MHGGNWTTKSSGDILTSGARLTGLLSAYLALVQVVLLARLPALERLAGWIARLQGFDVPAILVDGRVLATPRFPG